jgi:peptidoglycan hydrolase CwlO-like protein
MTRQPDPNSTGYTNALLKDINHKFEAVLDATQPIPDMQKTLNASFEEVSGLRIDVEALKRTVQEIHSRLDILEKAHQLLDRDTSEIDQLNKRLTRLEHSLKSR